MKCKWCNKEFRSESTLAAHMCVKKRRWADKDMSHIRLGHRAFQMFYDINTSATKPKTIEDFIMSQYYEAFVKFGRSCTVNEWLEPEKFTEWLIKNGVKLKVWTSDRQYDKFVKEYCRKEPGLRALERTIIYLAKWSEDTGEKWQDYFTTVSPSRAVHDIRSAKVSPWVIYLSSTGNNLLERFNDEQVKLIEDMIDPPFWMKLFTASKEEVKQIKQTCKDANI
jgi:hypothetical protein|tara:strand:+ start:6005 stop:6673 length:669 start_codon:yes stop_codon:yes gene_type:complete